MGALIIQHLKLPEESQCKVGDKHWFNCISKITCRFFLNRLATQWSSLLDCNSGSCRYRANYLHLILELLQPRDSWIVLFSVDVFLKTDFNRKEHDSSPSFFLPLLIDFWPEEKHTDVSYNLLPRHTSRTDNHCSCLCTLSMKFHLLAELQWRQRHSRGKS